MINSRRNVQICTANTIAAIIAILMVVKMLYQIQYIDHNNWNINCTVNINIQSIKELFDRLSISYIPKKEFYFYSVYNKIIIDINYNFDN